jgi:hypothetical protein
MNNAQREMTELLEAMSLEQARRAIASGSFGDVGSPNHEFCSSWLSAKESTAREEREEESLSISRKALRISIWATIIAAIALIVAAIDGKDHLISLFSK